jgi:hypothetical protein
MIEVKSLIDPNMLIEIEVTAVVWDWITEYDLLDL